MSKPKKPSPRPKTQFAPGYTEVKVTASDVCRGRDHDYKFACFEDPESATRIIAQWEGAGWQPIQIVAGCWSESRAFRPIGFTVFFRREASSSAA